LLLSVSCPLSVRIEVVLKVLSSDLVHCLAAVLVRCLVDTVTLANSSSRCCEKERQAHELLFHVPVLHSFHSGKIIMIHKSVNLRPRLEYKS
jgi:hypothetical protein